MTKNKNTKEPKPQDGQGLETATCYALVLYIYDYNEWEETFAVSFDPEKLKDEYDASDHLYRDRPLIECDDHQAWGDREEIHWVIEPVKFLA